MKKTIKLIQEQEYDTETDAVFITKEGILVKNVKGLKKLSLWGNDIKEIKNIPKGLKVLHLGYNQLTEIKNIPKGLKKLYLGVNNITEIKNIPKGLKELY